MYSKFLHKVLAIFFVFAFQLPSLLQLEHSFKGHEHLHLCETIGDINVIHQESESDCDYLHIPIQFNFTFELFNVDLVNHSDQFPIVFHKALNLSLQNIGFNQLRAPPYLVLIFEI